MSLTPFSKKKKPSATIEVEKGNFALSLSLPPLCGWAKEGIGRRSREKKRKEGKEGAPIAFFLSLKNLILVPSPLL